MTQTRKDSNLIETYVKLVDLENLTEIKPFHNELKMLREDKLNPTLKFIKEIRSDLEILKREACRSILKKPKDAEYLRRRMFDMEQKITGLKREIKQDLILLMKNRIGLCNELEVVRGRVENWGKSDHSIKYKSVNARIQSNIKSRNSLNPTTEFQTFLSTSGGHYGGWEEQDHLLFLRERKKNKKKETFFSNLQHLLPDFTYNEILEHENWYLQYESLKNCQKKAIEKWKREKIESQNQKAENLNEEKNNKINEKSGHRKSITQRIRKWREEQLSRKIEEEEKRQRIEKITLQKEEQKKREVQEMKKLAVSQYKAEKLKKLEKENEKNNRDPQLLQEAKARNRILIKSFRFQDNKFVEKKKMLRLQLEYKGNNKVERLKLAKPAIELILRRDPQRIFQPTLIWSLHCRSNEIREKITPTFDLNLIPRLATPEWRRELK